MENIDTALLLMAVGMTTVFAILLIVINMSKALIYFVNKYAPEEVLPKKRSVPSPKVNPNVSSPSQAVANPVAAATTAAIVSAVSVITAGKGNVVKIEKIK